jgi:hypothetical protein
MHDLMTTDLDQALAQQDAYLAGLDAMVEAGEQHSRRGALKMGGAFGLSTLGLLLLQGKEAPEAEAGGSGDFYYSRRTTSTWNGFYGLCTNYDNGTGQQYHFSFKSVLSTYFPWYVQFVGTAGTTWYNPGYGNYKNFSNKGTDHTVIFAIKHRTNGGVVTLNIPYTAWR